MALMLQPLRKYADFQGRARRSEFWWFMLLLVVVYSCVAAIDIQVFGEESFFTGLAALVLLLPHTAVSVRRLHDTQRSGWWLLIMFVPLVGLLALLYFYVSRGTVGFNRFGADPIPAPAPAEQMVA